MDDSRLHVPWRRMLGGLLVAASAAVGGWPQPLQAQVDHAGHAAQADPVNHAAHGGLGGHEGHEGHGAPNLSLFALSRREQVVSLPDVAVQLHDGRRTRFASQLAGGEATLLTFVYTSCTSVCPPLTQIFSRAQELLGERAAQVRMLSVSIDPENDSAARLSAYAAAHEAGAQWRFVTGSQENIDVIRRAFGVYSPDAMSHTPVVFVRRAGATQWVRFDGFAAPEVLVKEVSGVL